MKRTTSFPDGIFAIAMAFSFGAGAAQDASAVAAPGEHEATAAASTPLQAQSRHSPVAEKLGVAATPAAAAGQQSTQEGKAPDKRHSHQRDMK